MIFRNTKHSHSAEGDFIHSSSVSTPYKHGADLEKLPDGYYRSKNFLGSLVAVCLMALSLYLGYTLPVKDKFHSSIPLGTSLRTLF